MQYIFKVLVVLELLLRFLPFFVFPNFGLARREGNLLFLPESIDTGIICFVMAYLPSNPFPILLVWILGDYLFIVIQRAAALVSVI